MLDDPLSTLMTGVWLLAAGMYPLGFLFGACSPCCDAQDACQWFYDLDRCLKVAFVGSDPPAGDHCSIRPYTAANALRAGPIELARVPAEIEVRVRIAIRADQPSGTQTATHRWIQDACKQESGPCQIDSLDYSYDDESPGWHLEAEIKVTKVGSLGEQGIVSQTLGEDEAGQVKLFLHVNYFHQAFKDFEAVSQPFAIRPIGIQRHPSFPFRNVFFATLHSGDEIAGLSLTRGGLTPVTKQTEAVNFLSSGACSPLLRSAWKFSGVPGFLNGDTLRVDGQFGGQYDLTLLPSTVLCDYGVGDLREGIALGIYPELILLSNSAASNNPCFGPLSYELRTPGPATPCSVNWEGDVRLPGARAGSMAFRPPSTFYAGNSLLWAQETGPYRRSFTQGTATYSLDGQATANNLHPYWFGDIYGPRACRDYEFLPCYPTTITVSYPEDTLNAGFYFPGVLPPFNEPCEDGYIQPEPLTVPSGSTWLFEGKPEFANFDSTIFSASPELSDAWYNARLFYWGFKQYNQIEGTGIDEALEFTLATGETILGQVAQWFFAWGYYDSCGLPENVSLSGMMFTRVGSFRTIDLNVPWGLRGFLPIVCTNPNVFSGQNYNDPVSFSAGTIEVRNPLRKFCGPWSPSTLPATGGTLTRQCEVSDGPNESTYTTLEETIEVAPSRALVDRAIAPGVIQEAACKLVSLRNAQTNRFEFAGSDGLTHSFTPTSSSPCKYLRPLFSTDIPSGTLCGATGPAPAGPYPGKASVDSDSPCLDLCSIDVSVTQNSEQLSAVFLEDGDRKGLIRLAAKEGWGPGSVATLTVSCGDSTITATITG